MIGKNDYKYYKKMKSFNKKIKITKNLIILKTIKNININ